MIRGKILKADGSAAPGPSTRQAATRPPRIIPRAWVEAHGEAQRLIADATKEAEAILREAVDSSARVLETERARVREEESARLAARFLELQAREEKLRTGELARVIDMGSLLTERILGQALSDDPARIRPLAESVLKEARGARRFRFEVHPSSVREVLRLGETLELPKDSFAVVENPELAQGDVLLHTDLGTLDGRIRTQLERLRRALTE